MIHTATLWPMRELTHLLATLTVERYSLACITSCLKHYIVFSLQQLGCSYSMSGRGARISNSISIDSGSENGLQSAVANIGPIAVAVDARSSAFRVGYII